MKSNRLEAHNTIFRTPLFLSPSHTKYSPHHPALTNPQYVFVSWCKTPNFTPTQTDSNNVSYIAQYMQHSEWNCSTYCLNLSWSFLFTKVTVLLKFCQDLTYLKPDLQQSDSGTAQAMLHKMQVARESTINAAQNSFSTVQLFHEYRLPEKPEFLNIS